MYIHLNVPDGSPCDIRRWGATVTVRANPTDAPRGEHLRALPPVDPRYAAIYGHRQRAESLNETVKYGLPNRRARSYGQARQHIDLIFTAMVRNTDALLHWRARTTAHAPPLAA